MGKTRYRRSDAVGEPLGLPEKSQLMGNEMENPSRHQWQVDLRLLLTMGVWRFATWLGHY